MTTPLSPAQAIAWLIALNRKERYHLIRNATGGPFTISDSFRDKLQDVVPEPLPDSFPFVGMDYHLDWLFVWRHLVKEGVGFPKSDYEIKNSKGCFKGTQEDIDLVIAFPDKGSNETHIVLIEAKGDAAWSNKQFNSKAIRLSEIFGKSRHQDNIPIIPHFALASPKAPTKLDKENIKNAPDWFFAPEKNKSIGNLNHIELKLRGAEFAPTRKSANDTDTVNLKRMPNTD